MTTGDREVLARLGLSEGELEQIELFEKPLCQTAKIYLARVFERATIRKKPFAEILTACGQAWQELSQEERPVGLVILTMWECLVRRKPRLRALRGGEVSSQL